MINNDLKMKVVKTKDNSVVPTKNREDSGYDVYTTHTEDFILYQGEKINLKSGLIMEVSEGWGILFVEKGGFGNKNLSIRAGLTDSGYRGEVNIILTNLDKVPMIFTRNPEKYSNVSEKEFCKVYDLNKAITQFILVPTPHVEIEVVDTIEELSSSIRGTGKFGSTGK